MTNELMKGQMYPLTLKVMEQAIANLSK